MQNPASCTIRSSFHLQLDPVLLELGMWKSCFVLFLSGMIPVVASTAVVHDDLVWGDCATLLGTSDFDATLTGGCAALDFCTTPAGSSTEFGYSWEGSGGTCSSPGPVMRMTPGLTYGIRLCSNADTRK